MGIIIEKLLGVFQDEEDRITLMKQMVLLTRRILWGAMLSVSPVGGIAARLRVNRAVRYSIFDAGVSFGIMALPTML